MYGFVLTTHYNNYPIIKMCLDLLFKYIPKESYVILYVNETTCDKILNIKDEYIDYYLANKFNIIYIDDQIKNRGLTGTWNQGIDYLLNLEHFECKVITILGHDSFVNENISYILKLALEAENKKELLYFGPLCKSNINIGIMWQDYKEYKKHHIEYLIGFLLTFPVHSLLKNKINNKYFNDVKYPFAGNEVDWNIRFKNIKGKGILCEDFIVDHDHNRSWVNINNKISKENKSDDLTHISEKVNQLSFNWINYLKKNRDLKFSTERQALNHYISIGQYQNRTY